MFGHMGYPKIEFWTNQNPELGVYNMFHLLYNCFNQHLKSIKSMEICLIGHMISI